MNDETKSEATQGEKPKELTDEQKAEIARVVAKFNARLPLCRDAVNQGLSLRASLDPGLENMIPLAKWTKLAPLTRGERKIVFEEVERQIGAGVTRVAIPVEDPPVVGASAGDEPVK